MDFQQYPSEMYRHMDVIKTNPFAESGLVLGASCLNGCRWLGSLWYYTDPDQAGTVDGCSAGVRLNASVSDVAWVKVNRLALALDNGAVALWNLCDDKSYFEFGQTLCRHGDVVTSVSVSSDQSQLVSSSMDGSINIGDLETSELLQSYHVHHDIVTMTACHPTSPHIFVSCGQDRALYLWDSREKRPAKPIAEADGSPLVTCVDWLPSAEYTVATGNETGHIRTSDLRVPQVSSLHHKCHRLAVRRVLASRQTPTLLASVSEDGSVVVSEIQGNDLIIKYEDSRHGDFVRGVTWYGSDTLLTCGWDGKVISHVCNGSPIKGRLSDMKTDDC